MSARTVKIWAQFLIAAVFLLLGCLALFAPASVNDLFAGNIAMFGLALLDWRAARAEEMRA